MTYLTQATIAGSSSMTARIAQAAAEEGIPDADMWTGQNRRIWASAPGWDAAWESALVTHGNSGYDPGADEAVITDGMILAQVQSMYVPPEAE